MIHSGPAIMILLPWPFELKSLGNWYLKSQHWWSDNQGGFSWWHHRQNGHQFDRLENFHFSVLEGRLSSYQNLIQWFLRHLSTKVLWYGWGKVDKCCSFSSCSHLYKGFPNGAMDNMTASLTTEGKLSFLCSRKICFPQNLMWQFLRQPCAMVW